MGPGLVVRSESGAVVLDLDMDGDERTGLGGLLPARRQ